MLDHVSFKSLAAQEKRDYVDFFHELLDAYIACKQKKHDTIITDLLRKQNALVDSLLDLRRLALDNRHQGL